MEEGVVSGVRDLGGGLVVIEAVVMIELVAKFRNPISR